MCGIIGYFGSARIELSSLLDVMAELEVSQQKGEKSPVGGHAAGIAYFDGKINLFKNGKTGGSPVADLRKQIRDISVRKILCHVRRAAELFKDTTGNREFAQPYSVNCYGECQITAAHNGMLNNYEEIRAKLADMHEYESTRVRLNDSEIFPHYFEDLLKRGDSVDRAADILFDRIEGSGNALALWIKREEEHRLVLLYKGKARGLCVWANDHGELIFASRREPVENNLADVLRKRDFSIRKEIGCSEFGSFKDIYSLSAVDRHWIFRR